MEIIKWQKLKDEEIIYFRLSSIGKLLNTKLNKHQYILLWVLSSFHLIKQKIFKIICPKLMFMMTRLILRVTFNTRTRPWKVINGYPRNLLLDHLVFLIEKLLLLINKRWCVEQQQQLGIIKRKKALIKTLGS